MEILGTTETTYAIERLFTNAHEFVIIVSPYLKINHRLRTKMSDCFLRCEKSLLVYREDYQKENNFSWFKNHENLKIFLVKDLHAKCYMNENTAIITSMNLHDYSQINNHELGVILDRKKDKEGYAKLMSEVRIIINSDWPQFDFSEYLDRLVEYTMRRLYTELVKTYNFPVNTDEIDSVYIFFCNIARKLHNFSNDELYIDKSAVYRHVELSKEIYLKLYSEISKHGKPK